MKGIEKFSKFPKKDNILSAVFTRNNLEYQFKIDLL